MRAPTSSNSTGQRPDQALFQTWRWAAAGAAAALLCGCSALQIDVDVYKGPLLSEPEIQQRQYAYLAISARPLIVQLEAEAQAATSNCKALSCNEAILKEIQAFLTDILGFYTGQAESLKGSQRSSSRIASKGIVALTNDLADAYAQSPVDQKLIDEAAATLNESLIAFASRILFVVNHRTLYSSEGGQVLQGLTDHKPVLQSLANSILLHANDLNRQAQRKLEQGGRARAEVEALREAFGITPAVAFDRLRNRLATPDAPAAMTSAEGIADGGNNKLNELAALQAQNKADQQALQSLQTQLAGLLASFRTLVSEPKALPNSPALPKAELKAAELDRRAVRALYPSTPVSEADITEAGALGPLRAWLGREGASVSAAISTERKLRLAQTLNYLETDKARLLAGVLEASQKSDVLVAIQQRLDQDHALARQTLSDQRAAIEQQNLALRKLQGEISRDTKLIEQARAMALKASQAQALASSRAALLDRLRPAVLKRAEEAQVSDEAGLYALLKAQLSELKPGVDGQPSASTIEDSRQALAQLQPVKGICDPNPSGSNSGANQSGKGVAGDCAGKTQMEVVDGLISSLRAQRVKALAEGRTAAADNLLNAINVAYEQRTAMIYLRPASDYLRSVHSASDLQEASEQQYRNMVKEWTRYVLPDNRGDSRESRRVELEKLYWQNVNRVTVGGGGFTNFVLAKDDIGNWYVKAYSSDSEAILKSATQLALFNAGSRLNLNLLRRHTLQQQIDSSSGDEKADLKSELAQMNGQDGAPLLALRGRYVKRYESQTRETALSLRKQMLEMNAQVDKLLDEGAAGKGDSCSLADVKKGVAALDGSHLAPARDKLDKLLAELGIADVKLLEKIEKASQDGLTALLRYAGAVGKAIDNYSGTACEPSWRKAAASQARELPRAQVMALATERRTAVERYEDALMNISDVATQQ